MSFDEIRFPENIDFGFMGGPEYNTDVVELFSGFEQRNINWSAPRMKFVATHAIKDTSQINTLISFFRLRKGKANGFRFRDWADFTATGQTLGTGNGVTTAFQFVKVYTSNAQTETRTLTKIVQSASSLSGTAPKIYLNAVLQMSGYSINYNTGILTFVTPPGVDIAVTADFEFDVPVRFDNDAMQIRFEYNKEFYWENIALIELRI